MKAIDTELTKFLGAEAQYYVPIYQRKYSWKKDNCLKLIDDILKVAKDNERPCHFIGSVIYLAKQDAMHASAVKEYLVIDGQQRLTTISIVLLALGDYTRAKIVDDADYNKATTSLEKLSRRYLTNEDETGDTYYKVRLNEEDFYAWMKLLENRTKPDDIKRSKIFENYGIIYKALCDSNVEPQLVYDGIKKLRLVDICLVPEDNAQLVFETVNSTGLPLSTADKIRNFLLMTVEPSKQTKLYLEYWHPMEKALGMESGESSQFESFFNYYMTSVLQRQLVGDYYDVFKNYYYENKAAGTEARGHHPRRRLWCLRRGICPGVLRVFRRAPERGPEADQGIPAGKRHLSRGSITGGNNHGNFEKRDRSGPCQAQPGTGCGGSAAQRLS